MTVLRLRGVSAAWAAAAPLFEDVSLTLDGGFHGLVGANGAGKSTLLSVLAGELPPDEGAVTRSPPDALVIHCRQTVDRRGPDVDALASRDDSLAAELRGRLALDAGAIGRWATLSPGERKRWQVGAALAREPDVLLLDEPTNHLDAAARDSLLAALRRFTGLGVIVSHDRALLDALSSSTLRLHRRALTEWPGRYSDAKALWERARAEELRAHAEARERVRAHEAQLDAARRAQAAAARSVSAGRRMKSKHDSDARGALASTRASWGASKAGRIAAVAKTVLARAREEVPVVERDPTLGGRVFAGFERARSPVLFHVDERSLLRGERAVLRDVRVTVGRDDRVRIAGPNGAGKTTLLDALVGSSRCLDRALFLPQELTEDDRALSLSRLRALSAEEAGRVLSIFAALGSEPGRVLCAEAAHLSPGEARKLLLAEALSRQVWALVLDEPTNHLDLPSIERLEAALAAYPGAIVLVTHDDAFAAKLTNRTLRVERGRVI